MTSLEEYYGILDESTADELEAVIEARREARSEAHEARVERIRECLE